MLKADKSLNYIYYDRGNLDLDFDVSFSKIERTMTSTRQNNQARQNKRNRICHSVFTVYGLMPPLKKDS